MSSRSNNARSSASTAKPSTQGPAQPSSKPLKCRQISSKDILLEELVNEFKVKGADGKSVSQSAMQYNSFISHKTKGNKLFFLVNEIKIDTHGLPNITYVNKWCQGFLDYLKVPVNAKTNVKAEEQVYETSKADLKYGVTQIDKAVQDPKNIELMFGKTKISKAEQNKMEFLPSVKVPEPSEDALEDEEKMEKFKKYGSAEFIKFKFMTKGEEGKKEYTTEFYIRDPSITDKKNPNYRVRQYPKNSEELIDLIPYGSVVQLLVHAQNVWTPTKLKKTDRCRTYGISYKIHGIEITPSTRSQSPSEQFKNFNWGDDEDSDEDLENTNDDTNEADDANADDNDEGNASDDDDGNASGDDDNNNDDNDDDENNNGEDYHSDPEEAESPVPSPEPVRKKEPVKVVKPPVRGGKKK